jgi:hypothetical protein
MLRRPGRIDDPSYQLTLNKGADMDVSADVAKELEVLIRSILTQAYPEPRPAETGLETAPRPPTVADVCKMLADKLTSFERQQLAPLLQEMLDSAHHDADQTDDSPAGGDLAMLSGKRETSVEVHRPERPQLDLLKIIGVVIVVMLIALAGHASLGVPGLVIGLLIGIPLACGTLQLLRTPINENRAFDPMPGVEQTRRPEPPN